MILMIRGMVYLREDTCPKCMSERSLDLYDEYNKRAYFSVMLDQHKTDKLLSRRLYYFKCSKCGEEFNIDWSNPSRIPVPLNNKKISVFLQDYAATR